MRIVLTLIAAVVLGVVHVFASDLRFVHYTPRSRWLSFAGGVSVAYVFVHLLPELASGQEVLGPALGDVLGVAERHIYLISLAGLAVFYAVEHLVHGEQQQQQNDAAEGSSAATFVIRIGSFCVYNALIGYLLLHREKQTELSLLFFAVAMALHFFVNDFGLQQDDRAAYVRRGRWMLAGSVLVGWALGTVLAVPETWVAMLTAFLAGGVILNVLKEEVPRNHQSRLWPFLFGMVFYSALLLLL